MRALGEDTVATQKETQDAFTAGSGDSHPGFRAVGLHTPDLATGGLSIYASEMVRAALTTLIENSMPTSSAQALIAAPQAEESIAGATHPRLCFQET